MKLSLGNYYPSNSFLHRLDPRVKIVSSVLLMVFLFMISSVVPLLVFGIALIFLTLLARIPFSLVLRSVKPVMMLASIAFLINIFTVTGEVLWSWRFLSISQEGLSLGLRMGIRLFYLVMSTQLCLTLTTTPLEIADGIESLLKPLARFGFPAHELAMMMSIALRFVPTLSEETEKIIKAQSSRGADYDTGGAIARARGLISVLIPLFVSAFKRAEDLATAMEARDYQGGKGRSKYRQLAWHINDSLVILFFVALLLVVLRIRS